jgi:hypothetical protein
MHTSQGQDIWSPNTSLPCTTQYTEAYWSTLPWLVWTSAGLVLPYFDTTWVNILRILHLFENIFVFTTIQVCIPVRNIIPRSHLGQRTVVSIWYWDGVDLNNDSGVQQFIHLAIPTKYQHLISITILMPVSVSCVVHGFVQHIFTITIDVMYWHNSFTYVPVQLGVYLAWHNCCSVFRLCERRRLNQPPGVRLLQCSRPQRWGCGTALVGRRTGKYASHMSSCLCKVVGFRRYCNQPEREDMWSVIYMTIGRHIARARSLKVSSMWVSWAFTILKQFEG